jgi:hypothetical protein
MNKETFKKVLNAYDKIELNIDKIQEIHDMDQCYFNGSGNFKIQLIDRFLETSANKILLLMKYISHWRKEVKI